MLTTVKQDDRFMRELIPNLLEPAIEWIVQEFEPEDIYDEKALERWAYDNGFKKFE
jgi:hypothetical protein